MTRPLPLIATFLLMGMAAPSLSAAVVDHDYLPRLGGQVLFGTSGVEPGIFAEWRLGDADLLLRPEVFLNEDERAGAGAMVGWEIDFFNLPERQQLAIGPRVAYHNSDESGWEVDLMAIWSFNLVPNRDGRHYLEIIGAAGVLEEEEKNTDDTSTEFGASIGIGYGYQF